MTRHRTIKAPVLQRSVTSSKIVVQNQIVIMAKKHYNLMKKNSPISCDIKTIVNKDISHINQSLMMS